MTGFVYLIGESGTKKVKIGRSKSDPNNRLKQLQTGNPNQLELLFSLKTKYPTKVEAGIHRLYGSQRMIGEWFYFEDITELINKIKLVDSNLEFIKNNSTIIHAF